MKRDKYDDTYSKKTTVNREFMEEKKRGFEGDRIFDPFDKLSEKVFYKWLSKEDKKIRDKCLDTYSDEEVRNSKCE